MNEWLDAEEFRNIDRQLRSRLNPLDEIQLIIETDDNAVRRLPWHFWHLLLDYPNAEIALSAPQYQRIKKHNTRKQIRILAILGNGNGIDLEADRNVLLGITNAETVFLVEPSRQQLDEQLWDDRGWDILFFAGHSESQENGNRGFLAINSREKLGIPHLKLALKTAIARGLQLAIFNSCDGLGLARELADLQIPQMIVMREPVADGVAHLFLLYFVKSFFSGSSFYLAVRRARERLQSLEARFPCASWLPVICQNPAEVPIFWREIPRRKKQFFSLYRDRGWAATSLIVVLAIVVLRQLGVLQGWELQAYDYLMRSRPLEAPDERILIVEVTESDIQTYQEYPLSDATLLRLLQKLEQHHPRAIGVTLYRDLAEPPGHQALIEQMHNQANLFVICSADKIDKEAVRSPEAIPKNRLGFDDVLIDPDGVVRRHLFFMKAKPSCDTKSSLSFQLAQKYLATERIIPHYKNKTTTTFQFGQAIFTPLTPNPSGYKTLPSGGWSMLLNYRSFPVAKSLSLTEVLTEEFDPNLVKDKIIMIGMTASSANAESFVTPYSATVSQPEKIAGVTLQAQMVSQILSAALGERPLIKVWNWWTEMIWISAWAIAGGAIAACLDGKIKIIGAIAVSIGGLYALCWLCFFQGTWIPLIPAAFALTISSLSVILRRLSLK
jgi:CHASE2 domain-containing sensor protein